MYNAAPQISESCNRRNDNCDAPKQLWVSRPPIVVGSYRYASRKNRISVHSARGVIEWTNFSECNLHCSANLDDAYTWEAWKGRRGYLSIGMRRHTCMDGMHQWFVCPAKACACVWRYMRVKILQWTYGNIGRDKCIGTRTFNRTQKLQTAYQYLLGYAC